MWGSAGTTAPCANIMFGVSAGFSPPLSSSDRRCCCGRSDASQRDPEFPASFSLSFFLPAILIFGAFGEEMLFRGYALSDAGDGIGTVLGAAADERSFRVRACRKPERVLLGLINTFGFGLVLGYAYLRTGDLWLPIAIHFGWNWALVIFGLNVSGFKMGVTGYPVRWHVSDLWSGGAYGPEASVLTCGIIVALLWVLHRAPASAAGAAEEVSSMFAARVRRCFLPRPPCLPRSSRRTAHRDSSRHDGRVRDGEDATSRNQRSHSSINSNRRVSTRTAVAGSWQAARTGGASW